MTVKNKLGLITRVGATAALAIGLGVAATPSALAAAPVVTVTPASGLADGTTVTLSATGLTPGTVYHAGQCAFVEPGVYGCNAGTASDITADAQGKISTQIVVRSTFQAVVGSATEPWGSVNCKVTACQIGLGTGSGEGGGQVITFA
ncbi:MULTISPECIES: enediyne antibiotic chromoprotein [unclassified Streptomyces]|uniref:enediyne antibiotic chromoprotein n=1 Tax=unclassified Streptomyces TaxID=2593676 RepID=UPI002DD9185A|nr:enediyne antibiotic chromoprotein [Streptomyces sp. NBC_01237]WRZ78606.1 enediyne antibiotic chromoprotein [Streptomyces sp. NBC_01237]